jgi:signal transduction histidine kinase
MKLAIVRVECGSQVGYEPTHLVPAGRSCAIHGDQQSSQIRFVPPSNKGKGRVEEASTSKDDMVDGFTRVETDVHRIDVGPQSGPVALANREPGPRSVMDRQTAIAAAALASTQRQMVEAILSDLAAEDVLAVLARGVASRSLAGNCLVLLLAEDDATLRVAAADGVPEAFLRAIHGHVLSRRADAGTAAAVPSMPGLAPAPHVESEGPLEADFLRESAIACGFRGSRWLPLCSRNGRVLGTIGVLDRDTALPGTFDAAFLEFSARLAVVALEYRSTCKKLKTTERKLAEVQHVARIGSWERDLRTDRVTWSDELYRLFSLPKENGVDCFKTFLSLLLPDDVAATIQTVECALVERRSFACDYRVTAPDGTLRIIHDRGEVIVNEAGEPVRLVGTAQDVTELRRTEQKLQEYAESLKALSRRLVQVQEQERGHLAREIHDEVGQILTGLRLLLELDDHKAIEAIKTRIEQAKGLVDDLIEKTRALSFDLRPAVLDQLGLGPGLLSFFERFTGLTGVRVDFRHQGVEQRFAAEVETTAYRVVQESLTNVARHAGTSEATVRIGATAGWLILQVEDRGRGFIAGEAWAECRSIGLPGMRERLELIGGRLTIESSPGSGTLVTAELPLKETATRGRCGP